MAQRHRIVTTDTENPHLRPVKPTQGIKIPIKPRPALRELGNNAESKAAKLLLESSKVSKQEKRPFFNLPIDKKQQKFGKKEEAKALEPPKVPNQEKRHLFKLPVEKKQQKVERKESKALLEPPKVLKQEKLPVEKKEETKALLEPPTKILNQEGRRLFNVPVRCDPQLVAEYEADIFDYLRCLEEQFPVNRDFLENHQSTPRMRAVLINWLVQVHRTFGLCLETLHLCVSIIDRFLQVNKDISRKNLQLVGATALLIASKYEEIYLPELEEFVDVCDKTFSYEQFFNMEQRILKCLDFEFGKPLSICFLRHFNRIADVNIEQHNLGKYLLELALLDHKMSHIKPSLQAAAACCLSIAVFKNSISEMTIWTRKMEQKTKYKFSELVNVIATMAHLLMEVYCSKQKAVYTKYADAQLSKISQNLKVKGFVVKKFNEFFKG